MLKEFEHNFCCNLKNENYVRVTVEGAFNASDHLQMIEDIISREFWKPGMNRLIDSLNVDYSKANMNIMSQACDNLKRYDKENGSGKIALLMGTVSNYGKGRQFETLTNEGVSAKIRIFLDEYQAIN
jgi:hypothetical protein